MGYIWQDPSFGQYQMADKYLEAFKKILIFHVSGYEGCRSSRMQAASLWHSLVFLSVGKHCSLYFRTLPAPEIKCEVWNNIKIIYAS